jgi:branched-chain amino acid transport system ATP-binding protein
VSEPILRVVGLSKSFGGLRAANGVSLDVAPGEFRAIIGPNGAGKSTFFNLVTGFLAPDDGRTWLAGREITGLPPYRLFHAGMSRTFQITSVFAELSVRENLQVALLSYHRRLFDLWRSAKRAYDGECERLIDLVGLAGDRDRAAGTLSHGDQKKLELAVALASRPRLLLLDEPTAGMAAGERLDAIRTVHRVAGRLGVTVVFTEHDMQVVFSVADRIAVLHQGAIVADDRPDAIRRSPQVQQIYLGETIEPSAGASLQ